MRDDLRAAITPVVTLALGYVLYPMLSALLDTRKEE